MIIGVPREIKGDEYRVSMLPVGVSLLKRAGHTVLIEAGAGVGSGFEDSLYTAAGAELVLTHEEVFSRSQMIVKVKEPLEPEWKLLKAGQVVFTYFHFAADAKLTRACLDAGITAVAYETLTDRQGRLPLLTPMSEVAGRMSVQEGAKYLEKPMMGRGILLAGVPGVEPANVLVLGGGVVGANAARIAAGIGANVTLMDVSLDRLRYLADVMPANVTTIYSDPFAIAEYAAQADLVIGAVLIPGARAPSLINRATLKQMKAGAVIVDVAIDQGGCVETSRPTTHKEPTYLVEGIVHYCVTNMPGAVGRTSTQALCHATQPYVVKLAAAAEQGSSGIDALVAGDPLFASALNLRDGKIVHPAVAAAMA
jgi:alanine dehydrogenase